LLNRDREFKLVNRRKEKGDAVNVEEKYLGQHEHDDDDNDRDSDEDNVRFSNELERVFTEQEMEE
jgi:hypothetical protein